MDGFKTSRMAETTAIPGEESITGVLCEWFLLVFYERQKRTLAWAEECLEEFCGNDPPMYPSV
jgi:hypothetical protein